MRFLCLLLCVLILAGCASDDGDGIFVVEELKPGVYTITTNRDTVITTEKGAVITIPNGALKAALGIAKIEIREAYTIHDMMKAGLVTKAGDKPLSSGGMINIIAAGDEQVTIVKPVSVAIPTKARRPGMQVYKGQKKPGGRIDWVDPAPMQQPEVTAAVTRGEVLYNANCSSCHHFTRKAIGPSLAFVRQRRDWELLKKMTNNYIDLMNEPGDNGRYARCLFEHYNKTPTTVFPDLTEKDIVSIYEYVDYNCRGIDPDTIPDLKKSFDSCTSYNDRRQQLLGERAELVANNGKEVNVEITQRPANSPVENGGTPKPADLVQPEVQNADYYKFNIETFGWYNVDILMTGLPGFENSELMVRITGEFKANITVFMALKDDKIFLSGGRAKGQQDGYAFYTADGQIPLRQGAPAIIFAVATDKEQLYFGSYSFVTSRKQFPEITLTPATKSYIDSMIGSFKFDGVSTTIEQSANADSLRRIDSALQGLEQLKPKGWDCNCGYPPAETETDTASYIREEILR